MKSNELRYNGRLNTHTEKDRELERETKQDPVGLLGTEDFLCSLCLVFRE